MPTLAAIPAFFDNPVPPAGDLTWSRLGQAPAGSIAVFDDHQALQNAGPSLGGLQVFGYVATTSGAATLDSLVQAAEAWFQSPVVHGMFLDEGPDYAFPSDFADVRWQLYIEFWAWNQAHHPDKHVMLNCAATRRVAVFEHTGPVGPMCDLGTLVELGYARYREQGAGGWWQDNLSNTDNDFWMDPNLKSRFAHVIHSCPTVSSMAVAFKLAQLRNCEYVYIHDRSSSDYGGLPAFWDQELALLAGASPESVIQDELDALKADLADAVAQLSEEPAPTAGEKAAIVRRIHALQGQVDAASTDLNFCHQAGIG